MRISLHVLVIKMISIFDSLILPEQSGSFRDLNTTIETASHINLRISAYVFSSSMPNDLSSFFYSLNISRSFVTVR